MWYRINYAFSVEYYNRELLKDQRLESDYQQGVDNDKRYTSDM